MAPVSSHYWAYCLPIGFLESLALDSLFSSVTNATWLLYDESRESAMINEACFERLLLILTIQRNNGFEKQKHDPLEFDLECNLGLVGTSLI